MELNININLGITPELKETVNHICASCLLGPYLIVKRKGEASAPEEAPESQSPAQPEGAPAGSPSVASAEEAPASKRGRRSKKAEPTPAESTPSEAPATPDEAVSRITVPSGSPEGQQEAPASDLPFASETGEADPAPAIPEPASEITVPAASPAGPTEAPRPEMSLPEWKAILADTRTRLLLGDGQANVAHKRKFIALVRSLSSYYGSDTPSQLTPANLYYLAKQVQSITFDGEHFFAEDSAITPEQVADNQKAPF